MPAAATKPAKPVEASGGGAGEEPSAPEIPAEEPPSKAPELPREEPPHPDEQEPPNPAEEVPPPVGEPSEPEHEAPPIQTATLESVMADAHPEPDEPDATAPDVADIDVDFKSTEPTSPSILTSVVDTVTHAAASALSLVGIGPAEPRPLRRRNVHRRRVVGRGRAATGRQHGSGRRRAARGGSVRSVRARDSAGRTRGWGSSR